MNPYITSTFLGIFQGLVIGIGLSIAYGLCFKLPEKIRRIYQGRRTKPESAIADASIESDEKEHSFIRDKTADTFEERLK